MEILAGMAWFSFLALLLTTIGSFLARPGSKRFGDQSHWEIVRYNPPAAFFVTWARLLPKLARATAIAAVLAVVAVSLNAIW